MEQLGNMIRYLQLYQPAKCNNAQIHYGVTENATVFPDTGVVACVRGPKGVRSCATDTRIANLFVRGGRANYAATARSGTNYTHSSPIWA